jgi:hypothetical protein
MAQSSIVGLLLGTDSYNFDSSNGINDPLGAVLEEFHFLVDRAILRFLLRDGIMTTSMLILVPISALCSPKFEGRGNLDWELEFRKLDLN